MKLAVVTGATGFTGPFVVRALRERFPALNIRCVVRPSSRAERIAPYNVSIAVADLRDPDALYAAFRGADTLVNVASLGFDWTESVVGSAVRAEIARGVFVSTTAILTRLPVASKPVRVAGERLVRDSGLAWTILRPTMIYGTPADRNIARLIRFVNRWPLVPLPAGRALQQPVHVEDVAWAVAAALGTASTIGREYTLSGGNALTLRELVETVASELGRRRLLIPIPLRPVTAALRAWSAVSKPPITAEQVLRLEEDKNFDYADAARDFGFAPRMFAAGVRSEVRDWRESRVR